MNNTKLPDVSGLEPNHYTVHMTQIICSPEDDDIYNDPIAINHNTLLLAVLLQKIQNAFLSDVYGEFWTAFDQSNYDYLIAERAQEYLDHFHDGDPLNFVRGFLLISKKTFSNTWSSYQSLRENNTLVDSITLLDFLHLQLEAGQLWDTLSVHHRNTAMLMIEGTVKVRIQLDDYTDYTEYTDDFEQFQKNFRNRKPIFLDQIDNKEENK